MENPMDTVAAGPSSTRKTTSFEESIVDLSHKFPVGYIFRPSKEELILYYLKKKINGDQDLPPLIPEVILYKYNPDYLTAHTKPQGEGNWYFFTPRDRKYKNGSRPNRAAGDGFWKASGKEVHVDSKGKPIGSKRLLVFCRGKFPNILKTQWNMLEFTYASPQKKQRNEKDIMKLDDWVLCQIYKSTRKRSRENEEEKENNLQLGVVDQAVPQENNYNGQAFYHNQEQNDTVLSYSMLNNVATFGGNISSTSGFNYDPLHPEILLEHDQPNHQMTTQQPDHHELSAVLPDYQSRSRPEGLAKLFSYDYGGPSYNNDMSSSHGSNVDPSGYTMKKNHGSNNNVPSGYNDMSSNQLTSHGNNGAPFSYNDMSSAQLLNWGSNGAPFGYNDMSSGHLASNGNNGAPSGCNMSLAQSISCGNNGASLGHNDMSSGQLASNGNNGAPSGCNDMSLAQLTSCGINGSAPLGQYDMSPGYNDISSNQLTSHSNNIGAPSIYNDMSSPQLISCGSNGNPFDYNDMSSGHLTSHGSNAVPTELSDICQPPFNLRKSKSARST